MKLKQWALIAEVASGVAVVVTLLVLIAGVRESTNVTRAAVYESLISDLNEFNATMLNDPALATLWFDSSFEDLNPDDANRAVLLNRMAARIFEAAYFSHTGGSLGSQQYERFQSSICNMRTRPNPGLWPRTASILTDEFVAHVEQSCLEED